MAKSELFTRHGLFVKVFFQLCGVFPVQRSRADKAAVDTASQLLQNGKIVGIFPQGGIVKKDSPIRTKAGAALLAVKMQVPIWPVVIDTQKRIGPFTRMTVRFGQPLIPDKDDSLRSARNLNQCLQTALQTLWEEGHGN